MKPEEKKMENSNELPWYLQKGWSLFFLVVIPPMGYLIVLFNFNKIDKETRENRLFLATLFAGLWSLKFLPRDNIYSFIVIFLVFSLSTFLLFLKFLGVKK